MRQLNINSTISFSLCISKAYVKFYPERGVTFGESELTQDECLLSNT